MDIALSYQEKGSGEPLILLHGNGEDSSYFRHQIAHFQDRYRVIALDTRGHGKSPRGSAPFTIRQFARDLLDFLEIHGIADAVLLGFSDGANIAMRFAMEHPERDPTGVKRSTQLPIEIGYRIARHFAARSAEARKNAEMLGLMVNEPNVRPDELARITMPTLVLCGTRDMIRESHSRKIAGSIPGARLVILPGTHFLANQRPAEFNQAVDAFLQTLH